MEYKKKNNHESHDRRRMLNERARSPANINKTMYELPFQREPNARYKGSALTDQVRCYPHHIPDATRPPVLPCESPFGEKKCTACCTLRRSVCLYVRSFVPSHSSKTFP